LGPRGKTPCWKEEDRGGPKKRGVKGETDFQPGGLKIKDNRKSHPLLGETRKKSGDVRECVSGYPP